MGTYKAPYAGIPSWVIDEALGSQGGTPIPEDSHPGGKYTDREMDAAMDEGTKRIIALLGDGSTSEDEA